jgi:hypothetical protein
MVFRAINRAGRVWGNGLSPKVLRDAVRTAAAHANIDKLAPHDLVRTCARLCHLAGGELDQIHGRRLSARPTRMSAVGRLLVLPPW